MILVYITCRDEEEARNISRVLLEKRLISCSNFFPIKSMYWWKEKIVDDSECVLLCKTLEENYESVKKEVKRIHSYEIPAIIKFNSEANSSYEAWIRGEVNKR